MALNRDQLKSSFRTETIYIDALDDEVTFKDFSAAERVTVLNDFNKAAEAEKSDQPAMQQHLMARMVQLVLVDEQGKRMYGDDELDAIESELRGDVLDELSNKAMIFAGFASDDDTDEDDSKKS